jgi:hypothetical protein
MKIIATIIPNQLANIPNLHGSIEDFETHLAVRCADLQQCGRSANALDLFLLLPKVSARIMTKVTIYFGSIELC